MLSTPGAIEYEIGLLISARAWQTAQRLLDEWERPEDGDDLFSRAVAACYAQLQREIIGQGARTVREVTL